MAEPRIVNTYAPNLPSMGHLRASLFAVLVESEHRKYRCYVGLVPIENVLETGSRRDVAAQWCMANGQKQDLRRAKGYFPMLNEENYIA